MVSMFVVPGQKTFILKGSSEGIHWAGERTQRRSVRTWFRVLVTPSASGELRSALGQVPCGPEPAAGSISAVLDLCCGHRAARSWASTLKGQTGSTRFMLPNLTSNLFPARLADGRRSPAGREEEEEGGRVRRTRSNSPVRTPPRTPPPQSCREQSPGRGRLGRAVPAAMLA